MTFWRICVVGHAPKGIGSHASRRVPLFSPRRPPRARGRPPKACKGMRFGECAARACRCSGPENHCFSVFSLFALSLFAFFISFFSISLPPCADAFSGAAAAAAGSVSLCNSTFSSGLAGLCFLLNVSGEIASPGLGAGRRWRCSRSRRPNDARSRRRIRSLSDDDDEKDVHDDDPQISKSLTAPQPQPQYENVRKQRKAKVLNQPPDT